MSETGSGGRKLLIVGAHSGDFVWRAAGAIAAATSQIPLQSALIRSFWYQLEPGIDSPLSPDHLLVASKFAGSSPVGHPLFCRQI